MAEELLNDCERQSRERNMMGLCLAWAGVTPVRRAKRAAALQIHAIWIESSNGPRQALQAVADNFFFEFIALLLLEVDKYVSRDTLSQSQLDSLADAVATFSSVADLTNWLARKA